jgi:transcriptional regulator with XRE-family HTH domain
MGRPKKQRDIKPGTIADALERFRVSHGLEQTEWAEAAGMSEGGYRYYLDGKTPGIDMMQALARAAGYGTTVDDILRGVSPKASVETDLGGAVWRKPLFACIAHQLFEAGIEDPIKIIQQILDEYDSACSSHGIPQPRLEGEN